MGAGRGIPDRPPAHHPGAEPETWWALVDADEVVVTQLDDGAHDGPGVPTSSASQPSLVASMLRHLDVVNGARVLDIGTGTGWTSALLAARPYEAWDAPDAVCQWGTRRLWDEITAAHGWWESHGRPPLTRFGLTVTPHGGQTPWLDTPSNLVARPRSVAE
ncbi:protein-L-isoaspartate O-methyltransferase [Streptomyces sp. S4.7]|nr:protein-L-isoaspartate O-methyltransferase [Streptomyces sp. S4.7]